MNIRHALSSAAAGAILSACSLVYAPTLQAAPLCTQCDSAYTTCMRAKRPVHQCETNYRNCLRVCIDPYSAVPGKAGGVLKFASGTASSAKCGEQESTSVRQAEPLVVL